MQEVRHNMRDRKIAIYLYILCMKLHEYTRDFISLEMPYILEAESETATRGSDAPVLWCNTCHTIHSSNDSCTLRNLSVSYKKEIRFKEIKQLELDGAFQRVCIKIKLTSGWTRRFIVSYHNKVNRISRNLDVKYRQELLVHHGTLTCIY
ncbi:hypothetical protein PHYBLDRAFT_170524 [Phycomyces blakesleeanus NRRL 1555(-)]|uniref:Uncharacterized protein n=1 Tax=Phycomyces blakesleeanus (strain ATCC 8743b / DSM 1359 / FGSC 10004 / NBRC 33097 / NRRL 1555) TaxID=763407 RepID=A0A167LUQ0_PHYB8|nr:hypothetical protein PHYBLDRAFT_170524 [Phycomyces blakesleeanus NRRL 1555(-)]OAD71137.1 hypothetical protein PHYBLDRAFT_170524 [Phycomyces blakesleeanus NRRL 1555(-)]|eukprot:XP_018289177.1 hypothetical protein PHYBLDRAFT_170524 [Phycomyces blakesleeanus NRRL 1555(-)]